MTINSDNMKSYIHVYTGNGKGKTTAALGLALRAVGAGKKVFFAQFVKGEIYSEVEAIKKFLPAITIKQYGLSCFIYNQPSEEDIKAAQNGLLEIQKIINSAEYDMLILDEANIALHYNLFSVKEFIEIIQSRPNNLEVIITGRYAHEEIIKIADLVSEIKEINHYYTKGVEARKGIEY